MTFSEVLNMIRDTAKAVNPTGTFIHGRNSDAANASDLPYPRIHLYPFKRSRNKTESYKRTVSIEMHFVEADSGEQDMTEREGIISRMGDLCDSFLDTLETDYEKQIQFSTDPTDEPQYQILEGVSGYSLIFTFNSFGSC